MKVRRFTGQRTEYRVSLVESAYSHVRIAQLLLDLVHYKPHLEREELQEVLREIAAARGLLLLCLEDEKESPSGTISSGQGAESAEKKSPEIPQEPESPQLEKA